MVASIASRRPRPKKHRGNFVLRCAIVPPVFGSLRPAAVSNNTSEQTRIGALALGSIDVDPRYGVYSLRACPRQGEARRVEEMSARHRGVEPHQPRGEAVFLPCPG